MFTVHRRCSDSSKLVKQGNLNLLLTCCACCAVLCCAVPAVPCHAVLCCAVLCCAVLCCAGNRATDAYRNGYIAQQKVEQTARLTGLPVSLATSLAGSGRALSSSGRTLVSCGSTLSSCASVVGSSRPQTVATSQSQLGMRRSADWMPIAAGAVASVSGKPSSMFWPGFYCLISSLHGEQSAFCSLHSYFWMQY